MSLPIPLDYAVMEADPAKAIPEGEHWQYEPKWDGFRCLAFRDGETIELQSKSGQPLARYFPEVVAAFAALQAKQFVLDGEIVIPIDGQLSFDALLQRIHPAESRIRKLAKETPAQVVLFDLLVDENGKLLADSQLPERRTALEKFASKHLEGNAALHVSPYTCELAEAKRWFFDMAGGLDGVIAKRTDIPYASGTREGMLKIKNLRSADCVVGGFRYAAKGKVVGSLLLGLYDSDGKLHHVGYTSGLAASEKKSLTAKLEELIEAPGFTGAAPGGPSRWATERSTEWQPLAPKLVVEVQYDHFTGGRFRHGTKLMRWRPDKKASQCQMSQVMKESSSPMGLLAE